MAETEPHGHHSDDVTETKASTVHDVAQRDLAVQLSGPLVGGTSEETKPLFDLFVFVLSEPLNLEARKAVRETWGARALSMGNVTLVFVVPEVTTDGYTHVEEAKKQELAREAAKHHDILFFRGLESDEKLSLIRRLQQWAIEEAPLDFRYMLQVSDHSYVAMEALLHSLERKPRSHFLLGPAAEVLASESMEEFLEISPSYLMSKDVARLCATNNAPQLGSLSGTGDTRFETCGCCAGVLVSSHFRPSTVYQLESNMKKYGNGVSEVCSGIEKDFAYFGFKEKLPEFFDLEEPITDENSAILGEAVTVQSCIYLLVAVLVLVVFCCRQRMAHLAMERANCMSRNRQDPLGPIFRSRPIKEK